MRRAELKITEAAASVGYKTQKTGFQIGRARTKVRIYRELFNATPNISFW